ncbi:MULTISPECIES: hypothetical protein [unclassified Nostoc]|uniref:hypothetical protein n=1 Tax=unclassified Nostoc TaxID=2593658 RepID=UPI0025CE9C72|nr:MULTISPECIES: hypothetical protein [unclassified Nostoc]
MKGWQAYDWQFVYQQREAHCYCQVKRAGATIHSRADRHCLGSRRRGQLRSYSRSRW